MHHSRLRLRRHLRGAIGAGVTALFSACNPADVGAQLVKISRGDAFAVHNYFHVSPESPDGRKVAYTLYPDGPHEGLSGPSEVYVHDRAAGTHRKVGEVRAADQHRGAAPTWIDDRRLAFQDGWTVYVVDVESGERKVFPGAADNYSPVTGKMYFPALGPYPQGPGEPVDPEAARFRRGIYSLDIETGELALLVEMEQMRRFSPLGGVAYSPTEWRVVHTYPSPDGSRLAFAIFVGGPTEGYVFTANIDGSDVRLFGPKPMHWSFLDDRSFFGHDDKRDRGDKHMRRWSLDGEVMEDLAGPGNHGAVSPDGKWIVTEDWYGSDPVRVLLYRRGEATPRKVLAVQAANWKYRSHVHPAFSRDGRRVYFNYNAPGSRGSQVYAYDLGDIVDRDDAPAEAAYRVGPLLHGDDFSSGMEDWRAEFSPAGGSSVAARDGKLVIDVAEGATVWFREKLSGNLMIEYEASVADRGEPRDRVSDLNVFWMASEPDGGAPLPRGGTFPEYDGLRLYYVGFGGNDNTTTRFRRYDGSGAKPLLAEYGVPGRLLEGNRTYRIRITVHEGQTRYYVDGQRFFEHDDPQPLREGYFGFRAVRTRHLIDDFRVYRLE